MLSRLTAICLLAAAVILTGCGRGSHDDAHHDHADHGHAEPAADASHDDHDDHDHAGHDHGATTAAEEEDHTGHHHGPNEGELVYNEEGTPAVEYQRDKATGDMTIWLLQADHQTAAPTTAAPTLAVYTFNSNEKITFTPVEPDADGAASQFTAQSDALKAANLKGRFTITVDGQTYLIKLDDGDPHAGHNH